MEERQRRRGGHFRDKEGGVLTPQSRREAGGWLVFMRVNPNGRKDLRRQQESHNTVKTGKDNKTKNAATNLCAKGRPAASSFSLVYDEQQVLGLAKLPAQPRKRHTGAA